MHYDSIVYLLETPKYHLLKIGTVNLFSGWVFNFGKQKVVSLNVYANDKLLGNFAVNLPREDIAVYIPSIPAVKTCGFSFELEITNDNLTFEIVFDDQTKEPFFAFDVAKVINQQDYFNNLNKNLAFIPQPEPELIYLTQGHYDVAEYSNSIIPGVMNLHNYLQHAGVNLQQIQSLLDFGCGSGRLLVGWHLLAPHIELNGCDFNPKLLDWVQQNLSNQAHCVKNNLTPPLPYADNKFDLIYLISVFTHLSLAVQKEWIQEFSRVLKVGGHILITLHGEIYVRNGFWQEPDKIQQFLDTGFAESGSDDGSNYYASHHSIDFIKRMMQGFELVGYFPNGNITGQRTLFQTAQSQDIYIFRYEP